jgi:hypothetical protein
MNYRGQTKLLYDDCNYDNYKYTTYRPLEYVLYNGKYEILNSCEKKDCLYCKFNINANIKNNWSSIGERTDLESHLKLQSFYSSKCYQNKMMPCKNLDKYKNDKNVIYKMSGAEKKYGKEFCKVNPVVVNPYLAEREIVPSNMKKY